MAESEFIDGRARSPHLTAIEAQRVLDDAWRLVSHWEAKAQATGDGDFWTPDNFARELTEVFEHLLAHHAEHNGYGFLRVGIGDGLAEMVRQVSPPGSRPGWRWSGLRPSKLPKR
uniref:Uncharacterized protein n=1 Tax=uncultured prokaryote TaxID=198431 RepID=A0A0H5Q0W4_9ZZZZ|nr:hypothetical protein [uncultured prokaryote]